MKGTQPKRLVAHDGEWHLEIERMVPVGRGVLRPETRRIKGQGAIIQLLARSEAHQAMAAPTERLLGLEAATQGRSFSAIDGTWVPADVVPSYLESLRSRPGDAEGSGIAELRAELTLMRAAHQNALARLIRLEQAVFGGPTGSPGRPAFRLGQVSPDGPDDAPRLAVAPPAAVGLEPRPGPRERVSGEEAMETDVAKDAVERVADAPDGVVGRPAVKMPPTSVLSTFLAQLLGRTYELKARRDGHPADELEKSIGCKVFDDDDRLVGLMVAEVGAAISLGGTLLMLPVSELEDQTLKGEPSEDVLSAMGEVFNKLSGAFNGIAGNPHVGIVSAELMDSSALAPFASAQAQLDIDVADVGRIAFLVL
jgi:hypothetical protein